MIGNRIKKWLIAAISVLIGFFVAACGPTTTKITDFNSRVEDTPVIVKGKDQKKVTTAFLESCKNLGIEKVNTTFNFEKKELSLKPTQTFTSERVETLIQTLKKYEPETVDDNKHSFDKVRKMGRCMVEVTNSEDDGTLIIFTPTAGK